MKVKETIVYRFGEGSGRHGIERYFVTREPYDETQDAVYKVDEHLGDQSRQRRNAVQFAD